MRRITRLVRTCPLASKATFSFRRNVHQPFYIFVLDASDTKFEATFTRGVSFPTRQATVKFPPNACRSSTARSGFGSRREQSSNRACHLVPPRRFSLPARFLLQRVPIRAEAACASSLRWAAGDSERGEWARRRSRATESASQFATGVARRRERGGGSEWLS